MTKRHIYFVKWKHFIKYKSVHRQGRAWDFTEEAGLILAGGGNPYPTIVEQSTDRGKTFQQIQTMPYGGNGKQRRAGHVQGACLVIIDATTVFVAGGQYGKYFDFRILVQITNMVIDVPDHI